MTSRLRNWAGNLTYAATAVHRPTSVAELADLVARTPRIRALGTRHSFSPVADGSELVTLDGLPAVLEVAPDRRSVSVSAGARYGEIGPALHAHGLALANLASLPHISVAGSVATGTHGSGHRLGSLATQVSGLEMITATGDVVELRRDRDIQRLNASVVGLGALGVVTQLTLDVVPAFDVRQYVHEVPSLRPVVDGIDDVLDVAYSVSVFTDWQSSHQVWVKEMAADEPHHHGAGWLGGQPADGPRHPVAGQDAGRATEQLGVAGPWHERLPHFRLDHTPSSGDELQSEYLVDRADARAALVALLDLRDLVSPVLQVSELRTVAADELWLSPAYRRDSLAVHFTWLPDAAAVLPVVAEVERALGSFAPRPHWGKVFTIPPDEVRAVYPQADAFRALATDTDPDGRFRNRMLDEYLPAYS
ncbi:MAG TPA: FAD-binding protein [Actinomycetes bacterium]